MDHQPKAKTIKFLGRKTGENLHNLGQAAISYVGYQKHKTNQK